MVAASSEDNLDDGCFSSILKISFSMIGGTEFSRLGKSVILKFRKKKKIRMSPKSPKFLKALVKSKVIEILL